MADIQQLSLTTAPAAVQAGSVVVLTQTIVNQLSAQQKTALANQLVPDMLVSCVITDSQTGAQLADWTAQASILDLFRQLPATQRQQVRDDLVLRVIQARLAGANLS